MAWHAGEGPLPGEPAAERASYTGPMGGPGARIAGLALGWLAGVAAHLQERSLWPVASYAVAAVLGLVGVIVPLAAWHTARRRRVLGPTMLLAAAAICGFGTSGLRAALRMADA